MINRQKLAQGLVEVLFGSFPDRAGHDDVWEVSCAFSGGIDSTVIAASAQKLFGPRISIAPVVVGLPGCKDLKAASSAAEELGLALELEEVSLTPEAILEAIPKVTAFTRSLDPVVVSFTMPLYFVLATKGPRDVLVGHGADELFGGYSRYLRLRPSELQKHLDMDLCTAIDRVEGDRMMARLMDRELVTPYLGNRFIEAIRELPPQLKVSGTERKVALRAMARALGLSDRLSTKEKTAAQYGSGIMRVLKSEAKIRGLSNVSELIRDISEGHSN